MAFAANAVRDAIGNFCDDPARYCDLAVIERPDVAKTVRDAFMELMGLAQQFDVNFQACVDSRTAFERNRVAELAGYDEKIAMSAPSDIEINTVVGSLEHGDNVFLTPSGTRDPRLGKQQEVRDHPDRRGTVTSLRAVRRPSDGAQLMARRNTYTGLFEASAKCQDCSFEVFSRNSIGLAAQHADRHPDHEVQAQQVIGITYNRKDPKPT
jgi:hypothetical protein